MKTPLDAGHSYRPDIDGLRAVAVLSVVLYHAFPPLLGGGFVGVDLFFVISGYLISKHILSDLSAGSFSVRDFYARRIRRIFPALAAVLIACLAFGWVILTPGEYENLGRQVLAGSWFLSNFLSWREAGYFDAAADTKPLLHLWSLGIEEQFYIVWPLLLALAWRRRGALRWALPGVIVFSMAHSVAVVGHDVVADFYSPLTRFWELALGAAVAYFGPSRPHGGPVDGTLGSWLGLGLIVAGLTVIQSDFLFPGLWALLPCLGAALLIHAGPHAWFNRRLLSARPLVWVGLISYPLYLWHWPLLVFARIVESQTPSVPMRVGLVLGSVLLAWLTYRFIERPFRSSRSRPMVWGLFLTVFGIGIAGYVVKSEHGYKWRVSGMLGGDVSTMVLGADRGRLLPGCGIADAKSRYDLNFCIRNTEQAPRFAVLGDSKGEALFYGLVRESPADMPWTLIGTVYPPRPDVDPTSGREQKHRIAYQTVLDSRSVEVVVVATALRTIFSVDPATGLIASGARPAPGLLDSYSRAIQAFEGAGKRVVFLMDHPTLPDPTSCVSGGATSIAFLNQFLRRKENPRCQIRYSDHLAGTQPYRAFVDELRRRHPSLLVYDPAPLLCDLPHDQCTMTTNGRFNYSYGDHLSDHANSLVARGLLPAIVRLTR